MKILSLILICIFVFSFNISAQRQRWLYVGAGDNGVAFYVDKTIRRVSNGFVRFWEKSVNLDSSHSIFLKEVDCDQLRWKYISGTSYDEFGGLKSYGKGSYQWNYATPDSVGETVLSAVCRLASQSPKQKEAKRKVGYAEVITENANLRESPNVSSSVIREVEIGEKLALAKAEPVGAWYKVVDVKTKSEGWLHGNTFKIVPVKKPQPKNKRGKKTIYV